MKYGDCYFCGGEIVENKTKEMINRDNNWRNPFGDGKAGERIVEVIMERFQ